MPKELTVGTWRGMDDIKRKLDKMVGDAKGKWISEAVHAGAEVFQARLKAATPVGTKSYKIKGKTHTPGTAKKNVIIYERKTPKHILTKSRALPAVQGATPLIFRPMTAS